MRCARLRVRIRKANARVSATIAGVGAAVKKAVRATKDGIIGGASWFGQACWNMLAACGNFAKVCALWVIGMVVRTLLFLAAYIFRFWPLILVVFVALGISRLSWKYWPPVPPPTHRHMVHRPPPPDVVHRILPRDATKDSRNGDFYYLVNVLGVPFQTLLLFIGG